MKSIHSTTQDSGHKKPLKEKKEPIRSRSLKKGFPIFKDEKFNLEPAPWGFNWLLGYCEAPLNFNRN